MPSACISGDFRRVKDTPPLSPRFRKIGKQESADFRRVSSVFRHDVGCTGTAVFKSRRYTPRTGKVSRSREVLIVIRPGLSPPNTSAAVSENAGRAVCAARARRLTMVRVLALGRISRRQHPFEPARRTVVASLLLLTFTHEKARSRLRAAGFSGTGMHRKYITPEGRYALYAIYIPVHRHTLP